jgi:hypothetical protein
MPLTLTRYLLLLSRQMMGSLKVIAIDGFVKSPSSRRAIPAE